MCGCGIPNKANWYVHVIIGRDGETDYTDIYVCDDHLSGYLDDGQEIGEARVIDPAQTLMTDYQWDDYKLHVRKLFAFDNHEAWEILEIEVSRLR